MALANDFDNTKGEFLFPVLCYVALSRLQQYKSNRPDDTRNGVRLWRLFNSRLLRQPGKYRLNREISDDPRPVAVAFSDRDERYSEIESASALQVYNGAAMIAHLREELAFDENDRFMPALQIDRDIGAVVGSRDVVHGSFGIKAAGRCSSKTVCSFSFTVSES